MNSGSYRGLNPRGSPEPSVKSEAAACAKLCTISASTASRREDACQPTLLPQSFSANFQNSPRDEHCEGEPEQYLRESGVIRGRGDNGAGKRP